MFKQERYTFVDVVSLIFLVILSFGNFVGSLYLSSNILIAGMVALLLFLCYYAIIELLKRSKQTIVTKHYRTPLSILFVFFFVLAMVSAVFVSHAINVETNVKEQVQAEVQEKTDKVEALLPLYQRETENSIKNFDAQLSQKIRDYRAGKDSQLRRELLEPPYEVDGEMLDNPKTYLVGDIVVGKIEGIRRGTKEKDSLLINREIRIAKVYKENFMNWNRRKVATDYKELNHFVQESYDKVNELLTTLPIPPKEKLSLDIGNEQLPLDNFLELNKRYPPNYLLIVGVFVIIHFFILIPYFLYKVRAYNTKQETDRRIKEY